MNKIFKYNLIIINKFKTYNKISLIFKKSKKLKPININ